MLNNRNFPTGSQQFNQIIEENFIYVDKTPFLLPLVANKVNIQYCLSRPRRFGKSMLIDVGEGFYHAVIYLVFKILGTSMTAEVSVQEGRIDALVETDTHIYT